MLRNLVILLLIGSVSACSRSPDLSPPAKGRLSLPLETLVTIQGVVVEGASKGYEDGLCVRVHRVNGTATQQLVQLPLLGSSGRVERSDFQIGSEYEFTGVETGCWVGHTDAELASMPLAQTTRRYFSYRFRVVSQRSVQQFQASPKDFADRSALLEGVASVHGERCALSSKDWRLAVELPTSWPDYIVGSQVAAFGPIRRLSDGTFSMRPEWWSPVRLDDQVGHEVVLRCRTFNSDYPSWCSYRGTLVFVDGLAGRAGDLNWKPVLVRGRLLRDFRTSVPPGASGVPRDVESFVVTDATWVPLDSLLEPEIPRDEP